jgi:hypothetical protein
MILTQGEKMVWAAAFASAMKANSACYLNGPDGKRARLIAIDGGGATVRMLRRALKEAEDAFDHDQNLITEDDLQMLRAMLGDEG